MLFYFYSIIGPKCLLVCFNNGEPIPEGTSPVYTTTMRGLCVCASGLSLEEKVYPLTVSTHNKEEIIQKSYYYRNMYKN